MRSRFLGAHGSLLFRSYLFLAGGLLVVAIVLDFGFRRLAERDAEDDPWRAASLALIEAELAVAGDGERAPTIAELERRLGFAIRVLEPGDVAASGLVDDEPRAVVDSDGAVSVAYRSPALGGVLLVGPVDAQADSGNAWLLTPLFYLSILLLVGWWLGPILKDLDDMTHSARRFAADYREPLDTASRTRRLTGLARDLDEMSRRLSGLIQTQKELIAALSHEIRTPLARIRFALALVGRKQDAGLARQLEAVNADVEEIDRLIATMLGYARLDHPDLGMHPQRVPVAGWLREHVGRRDATRIAMDVRFDEAPMELSMDPRLMGLALSNLVSNALRHAGARVRLSVRKESSGRAEIVVEDDGSGIPESERETVFKAFTRLDDSRNRGTGGSGLGLAIVARIAALHGGGVGVDDSPELGGARFVLQWPDAAQDTRCKSQ